MKKSFALLLLLALCTLCLSGCWIDGFKGYYYIESENKRYYRDPAFDPVITQADFPFAISCTIGGEHFDIKGVYVAEYLGVCKLHEVGPERFWKATIFDENGQVISYEEEFLLAEQGDLTIYCDLPPAVYMMNDTENFAYYTLANDPLWKTSLFTVRDKHGESVYYKEILSDLQVVLLHYDIAPPIDNAFPQSK